MNFLLAVTEENPKQVGEVSSHSVFDQNVLEADRLLAAGQLQAAFLKIKATSRLQPPNADDCGSWARSMPPAAIGKRPIPHSVPVSKLTRPMPSLGWA